MNTHFFKSLPVDRTQHMEKQTTTTTKKQNTRGTHESPVGRFLLHTQTDLYTWS